MVIKPHAPEVMVQGVIRVSEGHAGMLADFYRRVWNSEATPERVRRAMEQEAALNPAAPGREIPTFAFVADGKVVGHVTTIPMRVWDGGANQPAHWVKGLMVLPEFRNGPVGFFLLKEAIRHLGDAMALVVAPPARRLFEALGFKDVGTLPNYLRVLRPAPLLQQLDHDALGLSRLPPGLRLMRRLARRAGVRALLERVIVGACGAWSEIAGRWGRLALSLSTQLPDAVECDRLWTEVRRELSAAPDRGCSYLHWRYEGTAYGGYVFVTVRDGSKLVALAVVRAPSIKGDPRLKGIRVATLSDLIFPPSKSQYGLAVVAGAEAAAREFTADALLCSTSHPSVWALLRRRAFVRLDGTLHFLLRTGGVERSLPPVLGDWWLTRGDSYADGV